MKKAKETEDILDRRSRAQSSLIDYSQSFASGSTRKFVNLTIPGTPHPNQKYKLEGRTTIKNNHTAQSASEITQQHFVSIIAEYVAMQCVMIVRSLW